jgi:hypothetical protein
MATNEQLYYKYMNLADKARTAGGDYAKYEAMAKPYAPAPAQPVATVKPASTGAAGLSTGNISLPVSGFTVNPSSVQQTISGAAKPTPTATMPASTAVSTNSSGYVNPPYNPAAVGQPAPQPAAQQTVQGQGQQTGGALDADAVRAILKEFLGDAPKVSTPDPYQSPLTQNMLDTLAKIQNTGSFKYDPNTDAALNQAQKQAMLQVKNASVASNRLYGSNTEKRLQEAAQGLIPQFQQAAENTYNTGIDRLYQQLSALQGIDAVGYNRYRDTAGDVRSTQLNQQQQYGKALDYATGRADTAFNQQIAQAPYTGKLFGEATQQATQQQRNNEVATYGTELSPAARQGVAVYNAMISNPQMAAVAKQVQSYSSDFAKEINARMQANPNDPLIPYLLAARTAKILGNPQLMQQYGADIGIANPAVANLAMQYESAQLKDKLDAIKGQLDSEKARMEIEKVKAEVEKMNWEAAYKQLETINLPYQQKAELQSQIALAAQRNAAAAENYAGVDLKNEQMNTEKFQQTKLSADAAKTLQSLNNKVNTYYNNFVTSGQKFDDWLKSVSGNNDEGKPITYGESMYADEFKDLIAAVKSTGKFETSTGGIKITTADGKTISVE